MPAVYVLLTIETLAMSISNHGNATVGWKDSDMRAAIGNKKRIKILSANVTAWGGEEPTGSGFVRDLNYKRRDLTYSKGDEIGRFKFGSTVILFFQKGACSWIEDLEFSDKIIFGQRIGISRASHER